MAAEVGMVGLGVGAGVTGTALGDPEGSVVTTGALVGAFETLGIGFVGADVGIGFVGAGVGIGGTHCPSRGAIDLVSSPGNGENPLKGETKAKRQKRAASK